MLLTSRFSLQRIDCLVTEKTNARNNTNNMRQIIIVLNYVVYI